jgi:hypothetical protein
MDKFAVKYPFERPVVILAAPRSGSTLLFETLAHSADLWTIGGESHGVFESIRQFNPQSGMCNSNALTAEDADEAIISQIRASFFSQLRNSRGERFHGQSDSSQPLPRLLEKTPKNAVRVSLLNAVFPDALFIYLYRNPRENISSMIDAWHSGRFITYRNLPGRHRPWSLLLPPRWEQHHDSPVARIATFQWQAANHAKMRGLAELGRKRWIAVSYGQQVNDAETTVNRLCSFCGVSPDGVLGQLKANGTTLSRYTLSRPEENKWYRNAAVMSEWIPALAETIEYIKSAAPELPDDEFDLDIDAELLVPSANADHDSAAEQGGRRNARCHCGSGKRFKHCHGDPNNAGALV